MAAKRKDDHTHDPSEATTKLSRLLETEVELEAMLKDARREAKELVAAAQVAADDRVGQFEVQLEAEEDAIRLRVAQERDRAVESIQEDARLETERLEELDEVRIADLDRHVIDLLIGPTDSGGAR